MNRAIPLILFLVLVIGGGLAIGFLTVPGEWYTGLAKPSFNPPNWLFAPVWTILYVLVAIAGWRIWRKDAGGRAMKLWWTQLVLNFLWSPSFFAAHQIGLAFCRNPAAARHDPRLHRHGVAAGSAGGMDVSSPMPLGWHSPRRSTPRFWR